MRLYAFQRSHSQLSLLRISESSCSRYCRGANTLPAKAPKHRSPGLFGDFEEHHKGSCSQAGVHHFPASKALPIRAVGQSQVPWHFPRTACTLKFSIYANRPTLDSKLMSTWKHVQAI